MAREDELVPFGAVAGGGGGGRKLPSFSTPLFSSDILISVDMNGNVVKALKSFIRFVLMEFFAEDIRGFDDSTSIE
jgi:hypothetical protein